MLEAVNSVLQNAPLVRAQADQNSSVRSFASNPDRIQEVPQAPYISPYISVNYDYDKAVLQIRDSDTGDVLTQFPSESRLAERQRVEASATRQAEFRESIAPRETTQQSAPAPVNPEPQASAEPVPQSGSTGQTTVSARQVAAFQSASQSGSAGGSGGNVSLLA